MKENNQQGIARIIHSIWKEVKMSITWSTSLYFYTLHIFLSMASYNTSRKCPVECTCSTDKQQRYQTICTKGGLNKFPVESLDSDVQVIIIEGPRNYITTGNSLRKFPQLEIIRIIDSNVPVIGPESLWGLQHLKILDFSRNNITLIMQKDFRGQNNLLELDLSNNKITNIASSTFCNLTELRRLNLSNNCIVELVQRIFFMLNKLKYLDLSANPLHDLPPEVFRDIPHLLVLKCRNCQLKQINPQLYNLLPKLSELDLGRNEFKFLDKDEFRDIKNLTKIWLDGNQLSVIVDELFHMQINLKHLDLSFNRLAKVSNNAFVNLTNLSFLDLSYNKLVHLEPSAVKHLYNLRLLNISGNSHMDLHEIRETFKLLPYLTHLSMADMGLLPHGLLVSFKQLRYLNISGNHLDSTSLQIIEPCEELQILDLSRNHLYGIHEDTALRIYAMRNVNLDNNPLICDECHMGKLIDLIQKLEWKWDTYPICYLPKSLRGAEITDLHNIGLDACLKYIIDEEQNSASTSYKFFDKAGFNSLAILSGVMFVLISIAITSLAVWFSKKRARYYTREDSLNESEHMCLERKICTKPTFIGPDIVKVNNSMILQNTKKKSNYMNALETLIEDPIKTDNINGTIEIQFEFPLNERTCKLDELICKSSSLEPSAETTTDTTNSNNTICNNLINNNGSVMSSCNTILEQATILNKTDAVEPNKIISSNCSGTVCPPLTYTLTHMTGTLKEISPISSYITEYQKQRLMHGSAEKIN